MGQACCIDQRPPSHCGSRHTGKLLGLLSRNELTVLKAKAELLAKQNELKDDFQSKHAENAQALAVHLAEDTIQFRTINQKLDRLSNGR